MVYKSPLTPLLPTQLQVTEDESFTEDAWATAMTYLVNRIKAVESFQPTWQGALDGLETVGLGQISLILAPLYAQLQAIAYLGVIFKASSYSTVTFGTGTKSFQILPAQAAQFVPGIELGMFDASTPAYAMYGTFVSYSATTGILVVSVNSVAVGVPFSSSNWVI